MEDIKKFRKHLLESDFDSIDSFLTHNPEFLELGKACIAYTLLECESISKYDNKLGGDWYRYFWNVVASENPENFDFKIYTFNYERSLQNYLEKKVKAAFPADNEKQQNFLKNIPIFHLHGNLGKTSFGSVGNISSYSDLEKVANHIKIISEVEVDATFKNLQDDISSAYHVVFVGFGFHQDNMKRMGFPNLTLNKDTCFYTSAYGLEEAEVKTKFSRFIFSMYKNNGRPISSPTIRVNWLVADNLKFLRNKFRFENLFSN